AVAPPPDGDWKVPAPPPGHVEEVALEPWRRRGCRLGEWVCVCWGQSPGDRLGWRALERMHYAGHLRAIGVSNYTLGHLQDLLAHCRVPPAVLQVEFHPELPQRELWDFCQQHGIHLQAYASLGCGQLLGRAEVGRVAERQGRTPAQVLLRWALHQGVGVIPKSVSPTRLAENAQLWGWNLRPEDMAELGAMDCSRHYCWDPSGVT
uniref:NADP-dependent oxidoreductase domain-containing protein n=1 Tax=Terrapene triunguis TaxID=2587831 RepID=A0A674HZA2_9SAUR